MKFVLTGQPNSGKSTIFNSIAGYRSATANFPGSSVTFTLSRAMVLGREVEVVDLPGMYSLRSGDGAEREGLRYLLHESYDVIVNVMDASRLGRSLELTLQLLELGKPVVIALNMMDEALVKGIEIDTGELARTLDVPVVPTVGRRGHGLKDLFRTSLGASMGGRHTPVPLDRETEDTIAEAVAVLDRARVDGRMPRRFVALGLLEGDAVQAEELGRCAPGVLAAIRPLAARLAERHGWTVEQVVSGSRHAVAHAIEDAVTTMHRPQLGWRERLDRVLLHPLTGGPLMVLILGGFFSAVFGLGRVVEGPLVAAFDRLGAVLAGRLPPETFAGAMVHGVVMGVSAGTAIVLPYLLPFLIGLAILEDTGYLPRMAYILDSFMHRLGLHGKSVVPLMLGYGCAVPAIMATRILESKRDRRVTAALTAFIPCSARTIVVYALVAAYLGPLWALGVYLLNLAVVVVLGVLLARRLKGRSPGLILEIPELRLPTLDTLVAKTWLSLREFVMVAWPILVASSVVLALLGWMGVEHYLNAVLSPLTVTLLGLPAAVGVTLVFGILRKELTLIMLVQALGTAAVASVLSPVQLMTLTLFVVFYVPCVATMAAMARELGWRETAWITGLTLVVAVVVSVAGRFTLAIFI